MSKDKEVKDSSKLDKLQAEAFRKGVEIEQMVNKANFAIDHLKKQYKDILLLVQKEEQNAKPTKSD